MTQNYAWLILSNTFSSTLGYSISGGNWVLETYTVLWLSYFIIEIFSDIVRLFPAYGAVQFHRLKTLFVLNFKHTHTHTHTYTYTHKHAHRCACIYLNVHPPHTSSLDTHKKTSAESKGFHRLKLKRITPLPK